MSPACWDKSSAWVIVVLYAVTILFCSSSDGNGICRERKASISIRCLFVVPRLQLWAYCTKGLVAERRYR